MSYIIQLYLYKILENEKLDTMYEDYIIHVIGTSGLEMLKEAGMLETCGVTNGVQLYTLVDKRFSELN